MANLALESNTSYLRGMNDSSPAVAFREDEAALLLNYRVLPHGDGEVRFGSQRTHTTALNGGTHGYGGRAFSPTGGGIQWVVMVGDTAYYSTDEGEVWTSIATGLREDYWDFATMKQSGSVFLLCANGGAASYKWDGTTWSAISGIRSGTKRLEVHNERLAATDGEVLDLSKIGDFEVWTAPSAIVGLEIQTHDGDQSMIALYSWGHLLLIFKRGSIAYVEGYGNADLITAAGSKGISRDVGCIAFRSLVAVGGNGLMWLSRRGFEFMAPGMEPILVSKGVATFLQSINFADIEADEGIPCAYFYPNQLTYECFLPASANVNDKAFIYRLPTPEKPGAASIFDSAVSDGDTVSVVGGFLIEGGGDRLTTQGGFLEVVTGSTPGVYANTTTGFLELETNDSQPSAVFIADRGTEAQRPVSVGVDGFVRNLDSGMLDDVLLDGTGGGSIGDRLQGRLMVFGNPFRRKRARIARVLIHSPTEITPNIEVIADGVRGTPHPVVCGVTTEPAVRKVRVSARGKVLVVDIQNAGAGAQIGGVELAAELLADRP